MTFFESLGVLLAAVTLLGAFNLNILKKPLTIGVLIGSLFASILVLVTQEQHPALSKSAVEFISSVNWDTLVMKGMLGPLLFFGALHANLDQLKRFKFTITALATVSVGISTAIIGFGCYYILELLGHSISLWWCLAFGAIISPTDPIAVMSILSKLGLPDAMRTKVAGEALGNDATSVVSYMTLAGIATGANLDVSAGSVVATLIGEVFGAIVYGIAVGFIGVSVLRYVSTSLILVLTLTGALATLGYAGAYWLHVSAPLAIVIVSCIFGTWGLKKLLTAETFHTTEQICETVDMVMNVILFAIIGMELLAIALHWDYLVAGLVAIPLILIARFVSVGVPLLALRRIEKPAPHAIKILTLGGLRGGISIAMAVSAPVFAGRDLMVCIVYICVVFSLLVQALALAPYIRSLGMGESEEPLESAT